MYFGVRSSILARLTGDPIDRIDKALRHQAGGKGLRVPMVDPSARTVSVGSLRIEEFKLDVPVYPYNLAGSEADVWPAVGVYLRQIRPRLTNFIPRDPICVGVPNSEKTVLLQGGKTKTGYSLVRQREHPRAVTYRFEIRIDSRYEEELAFIAERVIELFDTKGYLEIKQRDGSVTTVDTMLQEPVLMNVPAGTLENGQQEWSLLHTLNVEAYTDNTLRTLTSRTILTRGLTISNALVEDVDDTTSGALTDEVVVGQSLTQTDMADAACCDFDINENIQQGTLSPGDFAGEPKVATVTLPTAFADSTYKVSFEVFSDGRAYTPFVIRKTQFDFDINLGATRTDQLVSIGWTAIRI